VPSRSEIRADFRNVRKVFGDEGINMVYYESGSKLKEIDAKTIYSSRLLTVSVVVSVVMVSFVLLVSG
jgi:hypothetical protein